MGPKYEEKESEGHWETWKEHSNAKYEKEEGFEYRDGDNIGEKSDHFPEVGYQEIPDKYRD